MIVFDVFEYHKSDSGYFLSWNFLKDFANMFDDVGLRDCDETAYCLIDERKHPYVEEGVVY